MAARITIDIKLDDTSFLETALDDGSLLLFVVTAAELSDRDHIYDQLVH